MSIEQMRCAVSDAYKHSDNWKKKVKDMSDDQIIAIYHRFLNSGKIK